MEYRDFDSVIECYYDLYQEGFKKQANKYIKDFTRELESVDDSEKIGL